MRWEDERYVRVYTKDTITWGALPWQSRAIWALILRKVDRAGLLDLADEGVDGLADLIKMPVEVVEPGLTGILRKGYAVMRGTILVVPNFIEAQETPQGDAARKRASREKARAIVTKRDVESQDVTEGHETGPGVTSGHAESRAVTPSHSVPSRAVPSQTVLDPPTPKRPDGSIAKVADAWDRAGLGGLLDATAYGVLADALIELKLEPAAACDAFARIVDEWEKDGIESTPTPSLMLKHISRVQRALKPKPEEAPSRRDAESFAEMRKRMGV